MSENVTLEPVGTFTNDSSAVSTVNNNSILIENAFVNVLDRYGTTPNEMNAPLDMNSNQIINLPAPQTLSSPLRLGDVSAVHGPPGPQGPPGPAGTAGHLVYLTDFGVVSGDTTTDYTTQINAAFASLVGETGTVVWVPNFVKTSGTIVVGQLSGLGITSFINIYCPGGFAVSGINYTGSGTAIAFARNKTFRVEGLGVRNAGSRGSTKGMVLGGDTSGSGNQCNSGTFISCYVSNFDVGVTDGNSGAASEITFIDFIFESCNTGFVVNDFNSLDFTFIQLGMSGCGVGIDTGAAAGPYNVLGGSVSQSSTADFLVRQNCGGMNIYGFRSETSLRFVTGAANGGTVYIDKCQITDSQSPFVSIGGVFNTVRIRDSIIDGSVSINEASGSLEMVGNSLTRWDTTRRLPCFIVDTDQRIKIQCYFRHNTDISAFPPTPILDHTGCIGTREDGGGTVRPYVEPSTTLFPLSHLGTADIGVDYFALSHIRQLSEGSLPGVVAGTAVPTPGQNLRVSGTFPTSATLNFTFTRSLTVNASGPTVTATSGTFLPTDVGKPLLITAGADTGADWYGYITDYTDTTHVKVFPSSFASPGGRYPSCTAKSATVGANEPDANYLVVGIVGNAATPESYSITAQTNSGFTAKSSNASSTATINCMIVR